MKTTNLILITFAVIVIAACSSRKKSTTSTTSTATNPTSAATNTSTVSSGPIMVSKLAEGVHAPEDQELAAIQMQYKDVTKAQLNEGYVLYAFTACVGCHNAKSIYTRPTESWKDIVEDMAKKAQISDAQKDAVYKYVLAIKATQPK